VAGAGAGFTENLFWEHRTTRLIKPMSSTMLSAVMNRQYSSVFPLLRHCLPVLDKICGTVMDFAFFCASNTNKLQMQHLTGKLHLFYT